MKEESIRQKKMASLLKEELAVLLQSSFKNSRLRVMMTITQIHVTADLSIAKIYLSLFPGKEVSKMITTLQANANTIKYDLGTRLRHHLRNIPELRFFHDNTLDYIEEIAATLKGGGSNPIKNPELIDKNRKKKP